MTIRVTCTGCHTRFDVSEKFAGKEGPCPKCKQTIRVPSASENVEVHAPQEFGPKSVSGQAVFRPITRKDTSLSPVQLVLIGATVAGFLAVAVLIRMSVAAKDDVAWWVLLAAATALALPAVYAGYAFLRNPDLGSFQGQELWVRIAACCVAYGLTWLAIPLAAYAVGPEIGTFIGAAIMIAAGAAAAALFLQLDFLVGILHYGLFFGCCLLLRVTAGFSALPAAESSPTGIDDVINASGDATALLPSAFEFVRLLGQAAGHEWLA
jgi:hypothetical protein